MYYILYNSKAGEKSDTQNVKSLETRLDGDKKFIDVTTITDYAPLVSQLTADDYIVLAGGDGTLNRFINDIDGLDVSCEILYFPNGTGNDFAKDLGYEKCCDPFPVTEYLKNLPYVYVNDKKYRFLNGIGYGIDGYCCEVGNKLKAEKPDKKVNYTSIAVKGLLFRYKPKNAKVTVDGVSHTYKKAWLVPTMNGRCYGGGMYPTPDQKRLDPERKLSAMVFYGKGKLKTLMAFPSIFKGEHIKHTDMVEILTGHEITVEFDRPAALQIDGETVLGVTKYTAVKN